MGWGIDEYIELKPELSGRRGATACSGGLIEFICPPGLAPPLTPPAPTTPALLLFAAELVGTPGTPFELSAATLETVLAPLPPLPPPPLLFTLTGVETAPVLFAT